MSSTPALAALQVTAGPATWRERLAALRPDLELDRGTVLSTWDDDPWVQAAYSTRTPAFRPGDPGGQRAWAEATRRAGFGGGRATLASYHQMGSCRIGADPATSAVGPDHQTHEVAGLFVADASLFPTASGVNPMLSVMALAHRAAAKVAARLA